MMNGRKRIRHGLVCLVLLLNVSLGLYLFSITSSSDRVRSAYLERAYQIYSNEIYPVIADMELQTLYANPSGDIVSFRESLGLNSICTEHQELFKLSISGDTNLWSFVQSMVNRMYLILDSDTYSGMIYDTYRDMPPEDLLQSVKRDNQTVKDTLDGELARGNGYIGAFDAAEPFFPTGYW